MIKADFDIFPGSVMADEPEVIPDCAGVYTILMSGCEGEVNSALIDAVGDVDFFLGWPALYIGATDDSLRSRLKAHYRRDSRGSTFRRSLGLVVQAPLGLDVLHLPGSRLFCFQDERPLTDWLTGETAVGVCPRSDPFELEGVLLASTPGLLNISQRENTAVSEQLRSLRSDASRWRRYGS